MGVAVLVGRVRDRIRLMVRVRHLGNVPALYVKDT